LYPERLLRSREDFELLGFSDSLENQGIKNGLVFSKAPQWNRGRNAINLAVKNTSSQAAEILRVAPMPPPCQLAHSVDTLISIGGGRPLNRHNAWIESVSFSKPQPPANPLRQKLGGWCAIQGSNL
jgi:hypothetical protein